MKKILLTTVLSLMMCVGVFAQVYEWKKPPKSTEKEVGIITINMGAGDIYRYKDGKPDKDSRKVYSDEVVYENLFDAARKKYGENYPNFILRNFKSKMEEKNDYSCQYFDTYVRWYEASATVVIPDAEAEANEKLSVAIDKALRNVREGSRLAIDQVSVRTGINREEYKDQLIDILLDKGYRVVAKDYLEKLYDEIKDQQSGIYNDRTTVQEDNFSAVGYYINVKVTETSLRVQVVNVSTGEYEGNATVNF